MAGQTGGAGGTNGPRIVVVGGGAGGLELATRLGDKLGKRGAAQIILVDRNPTHIWKPLLHEVAAGSMDPNTHQLEYAAQARWHGFEFQQGELGFIFAAVDQRIECRHLFAEVAVELHGQQFAALGKPFERVAQVLAHHALDLACMRDDVVERAELRQPFHRGFRAHLRHAGHVVHGVANQRKIVDDALGRHAKLGLHAGRIERFVGHGVDQRHVVIHQLGEVLITR